MKKFISAFLITFGVAFIAGILVTGFWNLLVKNIGLVVDWGTTFRLSLIFALVIPVMMLWKRK